MEDRRINMTQAGGDFGMKILAQFLKNPFENPLGIAAMGALCGTSAVLFAVVLDRLV